MTSVQDFLRLISKRCDQNRPKAVEKTLYAFARSLRSITQAENVIGPAHEAHMVIFMFMLINVKCPEA